MRDGNVQYNVMRVHFVTKASNKLLVYFQMQTNNVCPLAERKAEEMLSLDKSQA